MARQADSEETRRYIIALIERNEKTIQDFIATAEKLSEAELIKKLEHNLIMKKFLVNQIEDYVELKEKTAKTIKDLKFAITLAFQRKEEYTNSISKMQKESLKKRILSLQKTMLEQMQTIKEVLENN